MAEVHVLVPDAVEAYARLAAAEHWSLDVASPTSARTLELPASVALDRVVCAAGAGIQLVGADGRRVALRPGEPQDARRASGLALAAAHAACAALVLDHDPRAVRAALALLGGRRPARALEGLASGGHAVVLAVGPGVRVRVSGEEEPFALAPGEALWIEAGHREATFDLAGGAALLALVEPRARR
jgi:hypothetical protein